MALLVEMTVRSEEMSVGTVDVRIAVHRPDIRKADSTLGDEVALIYVVLELYSFSVSQCLVSFVTYLDRCVGQAERVDAMPSSNPNIRKQLALR